MKNELLIFANPGFNQRSACGIGKLYEIFFKKYGYTINIVDEEFLKYNLPEDDSIQILVIAGGDGTIHRVINLIPEIALKEYIFGIIPGGTANEFAKSLRLPLVLEQAAEVIARQKNVICLRPGVINGQYKFATGFLYGIACKVLMETHPLAKQYLGEYAYQLPGLFSIANYQEFLKKFTIGCNDFNTGYLLVNSASLTSKGLFPESLEEEDKSLFSVVYLNPVLTVGDFLRLIVVNQANSNILHDRCVYYSQLDDFKLKFDGELDFMLDGEVYRLPSPINFEHSRHSIRIIV